MIKVCSIQPLCSRSMSQKLATFGTAFQQPTDSDNIKRQQLAQLLPLPTVTAPVFIDPLLQSCPWSAAFREVEVSGITEAVFFF